MTLDVEHLPRDVDEIAVFNDLKKNILIVHLLDRDGLGPYRNFLDLIPLMAENPEKEYVLEYGREYVGQMKKDYRTLKSLFDGRFQRFSE